jgi:hypothetical protein
VACPVDDAHAAAAEDGLHFISGDRGQVGVRRRPHRGAARHALGRREQGCKFRLDAAHFLPAPANFRQQFRARTADLFRGALRIEDLVEQLLHARILGHDSAPTKKG